MTYTGVEGAALAVGILLAIVGAVAWFVGWAMLAINEYIPTWLAVIGWTLPIVVAVGIMGATIGVIV